MVANQSNGGITGLAGFIFQIEVFLYYALKIRSGESISYEELEDVNINKPRDLDKNEDKLVTSLFDNNRRTVIQVKKTKITKTVAKEVLKRWILLEKEHSNIEKYILFMNCTYNNQGNIKNVDIEKLYNEIQLTEETSSKSINKKLKDIFYNNYNEFKNIAEQIKQKYTSEGENQTIDELILNEAQFHFQKEGVYDSVYIARINSLRSRLTNFIFENIKNNNNYILDSRTLMSSVYEINQLITNDFPLIHFPEYIKEHQVELDKIKHLREVIQLKHCNLGDEGIVRRIHRCNYYFDYRLRHLENSRICAIEAIEHNTYSSFQDLKEELIINNNDEPYKRLREMEKQPNSACPNNDDLRQGVCIYLTKDKEFVKDKQISWKDDENE